MSETKLIKGQAWIQGDSLVQEQLLLIPGCPVSENIVSLIDNIWDNLTADAGSSVYGYKTNGKKYFYWEVKMTDSSDDNVEVTVRIECPKPKEGLFTSPYDPDKVTGEYAKYWVKKFQEAEKNNEESFAIQKKVVTFPTSNLVDYSTGEHYETEEIKISNNDLGDITNLLNMF